MNKIIEFPNDVEKIIIERKNDGNIIISFFPEENVEFKDGDVIAYENDNHTKWIMIFKSFTENKKGINYYLMYVSRDNYLLYNSSTIATGDRIATEEERQTLFDKLKEEGYTWNAEEKKLEKIPWRAEMGGLYWTFNTNECVVYLVRDNRCKTDDVRYKNGFYFKTGESAQDALNAIVAFTKKLER